MTLTAKPKILIVDDEPVMRTITQSVLSQHDFDVTTYSCAEDALTSINYGDTPDLLLLDVLMPGMNGFEACRTIRAMPSRSNPRGRFHDPRPPRINPTTSPSIAIGPFTTIGA